ncbi:cytochrome P450 [Actinokineospora guangxiensis]|uniref:Cytochrome P450 n=1 Tax=Actinokineospora guangxiensis TaxID=1490288 RepID=A0ABW0EMR0_9PSEU
MAAEIQPMLHTHRADEPLDPPHLSVLKTGVPVWVARRHPDARQVLTDPRLDRASMFTPDAPPHTPYPNLLTDPNILNNLDGEEHRRLRRTVSKAFTPKAIARWRPWVASVVEGLIDAIEAGPRPADLISGFATTLPSSVLSRLMGLDDYDSERLAFWCDHAFSTTAYPPEQVQAAIEDFLAFGAEVVARRRAMPGDDLVSSLIQAADENGGLPEEQIVGLVVLLTVAGHEVTTTVIGNTFVYLLTDGTDAWQRLAQDESLVPVAAENMLRGISIGGDILPGFMRRALEDVEVGGVLIKKGDLIAADTKIANLDPEVFPQDPRDHPFSTPPTGHLGLGAGPHYCLGAWLAKLEMELTLHRLPARLPGLRLAVAPEDILWRGGQLTRSPEVLPVTW